jgi:hypothetical protein
MSFYCIQCGECCTNLGLVHTICETRGRYTFTVLNEYTGEKTIVEVDPDKYTLFDEKEIFDHHPDACPFFRIAHDDRRGYCTCHLTRPDICRDYGCWRLLILNSAGNRVGRIMEQRFFHSENVILTGIWNSFAESLRGLSDEEWDRVVITTLHSAGYTVII